MKTKGLSRLASVKPPGAASGFFVWLFGLYLLYRYLKDTIENRNVGVISVLTRYVWVIKEILEVLVNNRYICINEILKKFVER